MQLTMVRHGLLVAAVGWRGIGSLCRLDPFFTLVAFLWRICISGFEAETMPCISEFEAETIPCISESLFLLRWAGRCPGSL